MARAVTTRRGRDDGIVGTAGSTAAESLLHIVIKEYLILQYCNALLCGLYRKAVSPPPWPL